MRRSEAPAATSVGAPALESRPKAETPTTYDLIDAARKGRIRVPRFQRPLRWGPNDARLLLDSIYRGYPIGTLLFWQTTAEADVVRFGEVTISADARSDAWWVVDGQQRLTSLVRVLLGGGRDAFATWFDLDQEQFLGQRKATSDTNRYLPMTEVIDTEKLHEWIHANAVPAERRKVAFRLSKRLREYAVPAYIVETSNEDVLRRIFHRTNSSGKPLEEADVFDALYGARGQAEPSSLRAVSASLGELGFGEINEAVLYRSLLAIHGLDAAGGKVPSSFEQVPAAYARTAKALGAVIVFLTRHVGIPHVSLLPYKQPIVALAKFFDLHPDPSARSRELLGRWLWRGAWSGLHKGDTVSTRAILDAIDTNEDESVQRLLRTISASEPPGEDLATFNFRTARSKLEILAMLSLRPRHLETGDLIDPSTVVGADAIATLPFTTDLSHTIAARLLHPPVRNLPQSILDSAPEVRASHGIPQSAHDALGRGDHAEFLRERARHLQMVITSFLRSRAKWSDNDRPPIRALRVDDGD